MKFVLIIALAAFATVNADDKKESGIPDSIDVIPGKVGYHTKHSKDGIHVDNHIMLVFKKLSDQAVNVGGRGAHIISGKGKPEKACEKKVFKYPAAKNAHQCKKTCAADDVCVASSFFEKTQHCYFSLWHHATNNGKYVEAEDVKLMSYFFCKW